MAWYENGLKFTCTRCGNCCTGAPGNTWITDADVTALAKRLGMDESAFRKRYTRAVPGRGLSLTEKPNNDCVFFDRARGCTVYENRPRQCRTWPFWRPVLASAATWASAASNCPGMNRGELHDARTISAIAADDGLAPA